MNVADRETRYIAGLFLLALVVRVLYFSQVADLPFFYAPLLDEKFYIDQGRSVAEGNLIGDALRFYMDPLYSYFLGFIFVIDDNTFLARLIQMAIDASTAVAVYLTAKNLLSAKAGIVAALLYTFYVPAIFFSPILIKATLTTAGLIWLLYLLTLMIKNNQLIKWSALGVYVALLCYLRSNLILVVPCIYLVIAALTNFNNKKQMIFSFTLGLAIVFSVGIARNNIVMKEFQVVSSTPGYVFYTANHPENITGTHSVPGFVKDNHPTLMDYYYRKEASRRVNRELTTREASDYWMSAGIEHVREDPVRFLSLVGKRLLILVSIYESNYQYFIEDAIEGSWLLRLPLPNFALLFSCGFLGLLLAIRKYPNTGMLWIPIMLVFATCLIFFVAARLRLPMIPVLAIGSGYLASEVVEWFRCRKYTDLFAALTALVVLYAISYYAYDNPDEIESRTYHKALSYFYLGSYESSYDEVKHLLARKPDDENALLLMGNITLHQKEPELAIGIYSRILQINERNSRAVYNIGLAYLEMNDPYTAVGYIKKAIEIEPMPEYQEALSYGYSLLGKIKE